MSKLHRFTHLMHLLEVWIFNNPQGAFTDCYSDPGFALRIPV